jgi:hypothetical protein
MLEISPNLSVPLEQIELHASRPRKPKRATRPTLASKRKRLEEKTRRSGIKVHRRQLKGNLDG